MRPRGHAVRSERARRSRLCRGWRVASHAGEDAEERLAEVRHAVVADGAGELGFHVAQQLEPFEEALAAEGGEDDAAGAGVVGVGGASEDADVLQVVDELGCRLFGDAEAFGEVGDAGAVEVDVRQEAGVGAAQAGAAALSARALDGAFVEQARGLEQQLQRALVFCGIELGSKLGLGGAGGAGALGTGHWSIVVDYIS